MSEKNSRDIAKAAMMMAITETRQEEDMLKEKLALDGILAGAVDCGGEFISSLGKFIERTIVAAKREGGIAATHVEVGAVAGAVHEAFAQIMNKALGFNVGGKTGFARQGDHISVAVFFAIGMGHLNEVSIGMGHRAIAPKSISNIKSDKSEK